MLNNHNNKRKMQILLLNPPYLPKFSRSSNGRRKHTEETKSKMTKKAIEWHKNHKHPRGMLGHTAWNKGLTKETDERLKRIAKNISKAKKGKPIWGGTRKITWEAKISKSMKGNIPWNKGKPWSEKVKKNISRGRKGLLKGENSTNWRGGISFEPYGLEFNDELREEIRRRDNYICQECGISEEKLKQKEKSNNNKKLRVHHIDYDKKNNNPNNLISLCIWCHAQMNFNRQDWTKYFQNKLQKENFP